MVVQSVYLYDDVKIEKKTVPGIELSSNLYFLPTDEGNIAYKAAKILIEEFEIEEGVRITLNKRIPCGGRYGGGSSNAAAVLFRRMNRLFGLGLSQKELMKRGVKLGADVPYCIMRGTVLAGESGGDFRYFRRCRNVRC